MSRRSRRQRGRGASGLPAHTATAELRARVVETHTTRQVSFQGPIPPPQVLEQYGRVVTNGADRIVAMAESQQAHRQELESAVVHGNVRPQARGQVIAGVLALIAIGGGIGLIAYGKGVQGLIAIIATLTALSAVFITARVGQTQERKTKRAEAGSPRQQDLPLEPSEQGALSPPDSN